MLEFLLGLSVTAFVATYAVFKWRNQHLLSKGDAEDVLRRRFREGRVIGSRFIRDNKAPIWEFEILEGQRIQKVRIGAMTGTILNEKFSPAKPPVGPTIRSGLL